MKRRDFILSTIAGVGVISASAYYFFREAEYDPALAQPQYLGLILDQKSIKEIGELYRSTHPDESGSRSLVELLSENPIDVVDDFAKGKTVVVDGWLLSQTEARQCALASTIES